MVVYTPPPSPPNRVKVELKKVSLERDEREAEKEELSGRIEGLLSEKKQLSELLKETMSRLKEQVRTDSLKKSNYVTKSMIVLMQLFLKLFYNLPLPQKLFSNLPHLPRKQPKQRLKMRRYHDCRTKPQT